MSTDNPFALPGRFYKGNLHTHSTHSDGALEAAEVCNRYRNAGYDFIALTDHFLDRYRYPIVDTRGFRSDSFTTIIGAELHLPATSLGETWHILAVGLPLDFAAPEAGETAPAIARRAREAGAFVTIVHPAWYGLTVEDAAAIPDAHAVEIYNHTSAVKTDRGEGSAFLDQVLAGGRRITACATDDAHFIFDDAFGAWVMVKADARDPAALVAALKAGAYYSTQGPELQAIHLDGDTLEVECSPASAVMVLGRGSKSETAFGHDLRRARLDIQRLRRGGYGRVVVVDDQRKRAWSNPIWFNAVA